jgi:hypothetical protein
MKICVHLWRKCVPSRDDYGGFSASAGATT